MEDRACPLLQALWGSGAVSYNFLRGAYSVELKAEKPRKLLIGLKDEGRHKSCFLRLRYSGLIIRGGMEQCLSLTVRFSLYGRRNRNDRAAKKTRSSYA